MNSLEYGLVNKLIEVYSLFLKEKLKTSFAAEVYNSYLTISPLVSYLTLNAHSALFTVAYPKVKSQVKPLTKQEAKEILEKLKAKKKELEKQMIPKR